jgi:hypothetical protein
MDGYASTIHVNINRLFSDITPPPFKRIIGASKKKE